MTATLLDVFQQCFYHFDVKTACTDVKSFTLCQSYLMLSHFALPSTTTVWHLIMSEDYLPVEKYVLRDLHTGTSTYTLVLE